MRELLLVRKLEEENAKRKQTGGTIRDTSVSVGPSSQKHSHEPTTEDLPPKIIADSGSLTTDTNSQNSLFTYENQETSLSEIEKLDDDEKHVSDNTPQPEVTENDNSSQNQIPDSVENARTSLDSSLNDADEMSDEERKQLEESALQLKTRRESVREFFKQQQALVRETTDTRKGTLFEPGHAISNSIETILSDTDNAVESEEPEAKLSASKGDSIKRISDKVGSATNQPSAEENAKASSVKTENPSVPPPTELSPDEKRQKAAASRASQKKSLKEMMKQKRRQVTTESADENSAGIVIITPSTRKNTGVNSQGVDDARANADSDSDESIDLEALIAEGSDLDSNAIDNLDVDGMNDDDDEFWNVDSSELAKHLSPSTSPFRWPSPDPQNLAAVALSQRSRPEAIEEEEDLSDTILAVDDQEVDDIWGSSSATGHNYELESKEEDEFDRSLDTQITPVIKPMSSPSPSPSPRPSLSGGKPGISLGLQRSAFGAHFGTSPLSPNSSRASSNADPDEFETLSNGSHTSVRSTSSSKSGASSIRRPSTTMGIRAPSRIGAISPSRIGSPNYSGLTSPSRSRSMSIVSNSSAEESTTSSAGGAHSPIRIASPTRGLRTQGISSGIPTGTRARSRSRVSTSSTDEVMARPASVAANPIRTLNRSSTRTETTKTLNTISPSKKTKSGISGATNSKIASPKVTSPARVSSTRITSPTRGLRPQSISSNIPTGGSPRTRSKVSTNGADEALNRPASVAGTHIRSSLSNGSTQIGTTKISSTLSTRKVRSSIPGATNSKIAGSKVTSSTRASTTTTGSKRPSHSRSTIA